tara:strand:- start:2309 stop:3043 length:735 start_codon:yes stop_codon:yes gene_type:complete
MNVYKSYLLQHYPTMEITLLTNYLMIANEEPIPYELLSTADIFIYQHINNKSYHPSFFLDHLRTECKTVKIQSIYFELYFPDNVKSEVLLSHIYSSSPDFPFGIISYGHSKIEEGNNSYSNNELSDLYDVFTKRLKTENEFDTKIYEFINNNFNKKRLFYSIDHPSNEILQKMMNQISTLLCLDTVDDGLFWQQDYMNTYVDYIHDDIYKYFNLQFDNGYTICHDNIKRNDAEFVSFYKEKIMK